MDFKHVKYIFIDFDGTLVDSVPLLYHNYMRFLQKFGKTGSLEEFQTLMGPAVEEFVPLLSERYQLYHPTLELIKNYYEGLDEIYAQEAILMEGAQEFLDLARSHKIPLALVTSSSYPLIQKCLEALHLQEYFSHIITGERVRKTKPDPEIYRLALKICSIQSEEALAIEDSSNGIFSSLGAGIPTVALRNPHLIIIPKEAMSVDNWHTLTMQLKNSYEKQ